MKILVCLPGAMICFVLCSFGQVDSTLNNLTQLPNRLFAKINNKASRLDNELSHQTVKYLERMQRKERKLKENLYKTDSNAAKQLYATNPDQQYAELLQKFKTDSARIVHSMGAEYLPYADSLQGSLSFLNKNSQLFNSSKLAPAKIQGALSEVQLLQAKMEDADQIKQFMAQREGQIKQYISQLTHLPPGLSNIYNDYNRNLFYYNTQLQSYREILNDPDKMLRTALVLLNKVPQFANFMKSNSFLAGLFNIPADYGTAEGMSGLQSRDQVLAMIQSQIGAGGSNASSAIQNSLQTAQQDIGNLQNKLSSLGGGSKDIDAPNFKPNQNVTKTFLQRLEIGTNMQTTHGSFYFPTTTDLGLSVGYKLGNKSTVGVGASYKVGWGTDFNHVNLSSQGTAIRSFLDVQLKKSFYASWGFEYNYQPPLGVYGPITNISNFQKSGLLGISKIISLNTKVFKKTKIQFLWDFLSYEQVPRSEPFLFRVGYTF